MNEPVRRPMCRCIIAPNLEPDINHEREDPMKDWKLDQILLEAKIAVDREKRRLGSGTSISTSRWDNSTQGTMRVPTAMLVALIENPPAAEASIRAAVMAEVEDARDGLANTDKMHYVVPGDVMEYSLDAIEAACGGNCPVSAAPLSTLPLHAENTRLREKLDRVRAQRDAERARFSKLETARHETTSGDPIGDKLREIVRGATVDLEKSDLTGEAQLTITSTLRAAALVELFDAIKEKPRPFDEGTINATPMSRAEAEEFFRDAGISGVHTSDLYNQHNTDEYAACIRAEYRGSFATQELQQQPVHMQGDACTFRMDVSCPSIDLSCRDCPHNPYRLAAE